LDKAYYNLGVELEHLGDYEGAQSAFAQTKLGKKVLPEIKNKAE